MIVIIDNPNLNGLDMDNPADTEKFNAQIRGIIPNLNMWSFNCIDNKVTIDLDSLTDDVRAAIYSYAPEGVTIDEQKHM